MSHYEVVINKGKAGCDYIYCPSLADAKQVQQDRAKGEPNWQDIFIRQWYINIRRGQESYRVLHKLTVRS